MPKKKVRMHMKKHVQITSFTFSIKLELGRISAQTHDRAHKRKIYYFLAIHFPNHIDKSPF